ncbi:MAG: alpha/beta hydrolase [Microbacterium sp.]
MAHDTSEFRYLAGQAAALGVPALEAARLTLSLPDGRELSALRYGAGKPIATLLHGAGLNAHTWDTTALLLGCPVLAIDLAGHGDSSWREDLDYRPERLADDVALALREWTTTPQVLLGQSLGGLTAASVAARHPELVRELLVVDITPGLDRDAAPSVLAEFYAQTDFASRDEAVERAMAFGFGGDRADTERGVFLNTRVRADGRVEWKHHFAQLAAQAMTSKPGGTGTALVQADAGWADLAAVTAPITLVHATRGFLADEDVAEFSARLPDASVVQIDATHNAQETAPADLAALIAARTDAP